MESDIRILIYLFLETKNSRQRTIEQTASEELAELNVSDEECKDTFTKSLSNSKHWLQIEFFNDDEFNENWQGKLAELADEESMTKIKQDRIDLIEINNLNEIYPISSLILPQFMGIVM